MRGDREESDNAKGRDICKMKNRGSRCAVEIARFLFEDLRFGGLDGRTYLGQTKSSRSSLRSDEQQSTEVRKHG